MKKEDAYKDKSGCYVAFEYDGHVFVLIRKGKALKGESLSFTFCPITSSTEFSVRFTTVEEATAAVEKMGLNVVYTQEWEILENKNFNSFCVDKLKWEEWHEYQEVQRHKAPFAAIAVGNRVYKDTYSTALSDGGRWVFAAGEERLFKYPVQATHKIDQLLIAVREYPDTKLFNTKEERTEWSLKYLEEYAAISEPDTAPKTKPGYPNTPSIIYATIEQSTNLVMVLRHIPGGVHGTEQYGFRSISPLHAYSLVGDKATIKEAISAAEKCGHVIEVFTTDEAFMGWLGKLYAAPVLPFNGVVPRPTDTERIELLEKRVTQMRDWWGKKMDEFAETLRETLINKTKPEEDVPTRWKPSHRENGFYVVTTPTIPIPFVAHSVNGKWYIPGEKLHYAGYLRVHRKVDMNG